MSLPAFRTFQSFERPSFPTCSVLWVGEVKHINKNTLALGYGVDVVRASLGAASGRTLTEIMLPGLCR